MTLLTGEHASSLVTERSQGKFTMANSPWIHKKEQRRYLCHLPFFKKLGYLDARGK